MPTSHLWQALCLLEWKQRVVLLRIWRRLSSLPLRQGLHYLSVPSESDNERAMVPQVGASLIFGILQRDHSISTWLSKSLVARATIACGSRPCASRVDVTVSRQEMWPEPVKVDLRFRSTPRAFLAHWRKSFRCHQPTSSAYVGTSA